MNGKSWPFQHRGIIYGTLVSCVSLMLSLVEKIYNDYKIIVNGVIIFIGLFLCFLGLKSVVVRI